MGRAGVGRDVERTPVQEAEIRQEYEVPVCPAPQGDHQQQLYIVHLKILNEKILNVSP